MAVQEQEQLAVSPRRRGAPLAPMAAAEVAAAEPSSAWDVAAEILVAAVLVFMPFAFGTVEAWSERIAFTVIAIAFTCVAARRVFRPDRPLVATWAYLPVVLFLVLVGAQLVPLPHRVVQLLSPRRRAFGESRCPTCPLTRPSPANTLSLYPPGAVQKVRLVAAASMLFFVVVNLYRRPAQVKRLLATIAAIGLAVALLALTQDVSGANGIYWGAAGFARSGPYNNHNNYSQLMNLSVGAALALLLVHVQEHEVGGAAPCALVDGFGAATDA